MYLQNPIPQFAFKSDSFSTFYSRHSSIYMETFPTNFTSQHKFSKLPFWQNHPYLVYTKPMTGTYTNGTVAKIQWIQKSLSEQPTNYCMLFANNDINAKDRLTVDPNMGIALTATILEMQHKDLSLKEILYFEKRYAFMFELARIYKIPTHLGKSTANIHEKKKSIIELLHKFKHARQFMQKENYNY